MNFLKILQEAVRESGIAGGGPSDTKNQTNLMADFVAWGAASWVEIQSEKPWLFKKKVKTIATAANTNDYDIYGTGPGQLGWTDLATIDSSPRKIVVTAADGSKNYLELITYDEYLSRYGLATSLGSGPPSVAVVLPGDKLRFVPVPDAVHSVDFPYWAAAVTLVEKTDTPVILAQFHNVIVWRTVQKFAKKKEAWALHNKAIDLESPIYAQMMQRYLPPIIVGPCPII